MCCRSSSLKHAPPAGSRSALLSEPLRQAPSPHAAVCQLPHSCHVVRHGQPQHLICLALHLLLLKLLPAIPLSEYGHLPRKLSIQSSCAPAVHHSPCQRACPAWYRLLAPTQLWSVSRREIPVLGPLPQASCMALISGCRASGLTPMHLKAMLQPDQPPCTCSTFVSAWPQHGRQQHCSTCGIRHQPGKLHGTQPPQDIGGGVSQLDKDTADSSLSAFGCVNLPHPANSHALLRHFGLLACAVCAGSSGATMR